MVAHCENGCIICRTVPQRQTLDRNQVTAQFCRCSIAEGDRIVPPVLIFADGNIGAVFLFHAFDHRGGEVACFDRCRTRRGDQRAGKRHSGRCGIACHAIGNGHSRCVLDINHFQNDTGTHIDRVFAAQHVVGIIGKIAVFSFGDIQFVVANCPVESPGIENPGNIIQ